MWQRLGRPDWQTLTDALDNLDGDCLYEVERREAWRRQAEREAAEREARRPVCPRCGQKFTDDRWNLVRQYPALDNRAGRAWKSNTSNKVFGGNVQFLSAPDGTPLWVSDVEPGSTADITAARLHVLPALYKAAAEGLPTLADKGYIGAGIGILVPHRRPKGRSEQALHVDTCMVNTLIRHVRSLGERAVAELKQRWRSLQ
ncbi:transposase family protein [Streptomyces sp. TRM72054]|nr:transposase family protein [Streptomyces sp. TRM72054]